MVNILTAAAITTSSARQSLRFLESHPVSLSSELSSTKESTARRRSCGPENDSESALIVVSPHPLLNGLTSFTRRRDTTRFTLIDPGVNSSTLVLQDDTLCRVIGVCARGLRTENGTLEAFDAENRGESPVALCCIR